MFYSVNKVEIEQTEFTPVDSVHRRNVCELCFDVETGFWVITG